MGTVETIMLHVFQGSFADMLGSFADVYDSFSLDICGRSSDYHVTRFSGLFCGYVGLFCGCAV